MKIQDIHAQTKAAAQLVWPDPKFWEAWGPLAEEVRAGRLPPDFGCAGSVVTPSRHFMVRQATLDALNDCMAAHIKLEGSSAAMRHLVRLLGWDVNSPSAHEPSDWFVASVRNHYLVWRAQYDAH